MFWCFVMFGLWHGLRSQVPWPNWRLFNALRQCPYCLGFWAGLGTWGLKALSEGRAGPLPRLLASAVGLGAEVMAWGLCGAAVCYLIIRFDSVLRG